MSTNSLNRCANLTNKKVTCGAYKRTTIAGPVCCFVTGQQEDFT